MRNSRLSLFIASKLIQQCSSWHHSKDTKILSHEKHADPLTRRIMEMASTPPNDGVDSQTMNDIVGCTQVDNVGIAAESLESAVARLEEKFHSDDEGKTTLCGESRKSHPSNKLSIVFLLVSYCQHLIRTKS